MGAIIIINLEVLLKLFECIKPTQTESPILRQFVTQKVIEALIKREEYKCTEDQEIKKNWMRHHLTIRKEML